jgi:hypothetical protein
MATRIVAGALLALSLALAGCATNGVTTFATTSPLVTDDTSVGATDLSGVNYRVFPGDDTIPVTPEDNSDVGP